MYYESVRYTGIIWLPIRRNTDKEIECMSLNGKDCGWQKKEDECGEIISKYRDAKLKPLVCGEMHKKVCFTSCHPPPEPGLSLRSQFFW